MSGKTADVTKVSPHSVEDTIARLTAIVADRGLTLFGVIDHSGAAADVGLELRDTKVVIAARYGLTEELVDRLRGIDGITDAVINR